VEQHRKRKEKEKKKEKEDVHLVNESLNNKKKKPS